MEQAIQFVELDGRRIAYATVGEGPPIVFGGRFVTHLEEEWNDPRARSFFEHLARTHRVVRYDRLGAGLSDRVLGKAPTLESETRMLAAVVEASTDEAVTLFACSCAGLATASFASSEPDRVGKVVFFGGYVARKDIPEATRRSLVDFVRTNWHLASQMLAGLLMPHGSGDEIGALSRKQRHAAEADVAAAYLELDLTSDARELAAGADDAGARAAPTRRSHRAARARPRARVASAERAARDSRGRLASSPSRRPARSPAGACRLP